MFTQFDIQTVDSGIVRKLADELSLPSFISTVLVSRGVKTKEDADEFLHPDLDRDWCNPYDIPGLSDVADALVASIRNNENILVFGDFDVDGITATTVLTRALRDLGAHVEPFIPRRFEEGYGLTEEAFARVKALDPVPDLLITVDCGIACKAAVETITAQGIKVAITDHHEPADLVPEGVPVADPKLDPDCPSVILAGVGVALKLIQIVGGRLGQPYLWRSYTDFATLGTVADLMPMQLENRALVVDGLAKLNDSPRPCLAALIASAADSYKTLSATNLSFSLIPRLNAAGRMGDAQLALDLMMTDDYDEAIRLSSELENLNNQRRSIEIELTAIAQKQAEEIYHGERVLVVSGENWHEGVKGIVASRLVSQYGVPTLLFTIDGEEARGSGRSVGRINLFKAVESCADLLTRFGGHDAAVGLTLEASKLPEFTRRLCAYMDELPEDEFHPLVRIDACVDLSELTLENVQALDQLSPFGQENPVPCFLAPNVTLSNCRAVGADKNHFSCTLSDGRAQVPGIMFHCQDIQELMANTSVVCAAFEVQIDEWRGKKTVKAMLKTLSPARSCKALEACIDPKTTSFVHDLYAEDDDSPRSDAHPSVDDMQARAEKVRNARRIWSKRAQEDPAALEAAIVRTLIGDASLHPTQRAVLNELYGGNSVLSVMPTGRGKSLTFQVFAAMLALLRDQTSLFIYPLRALVADQAYHLSRSLDELGISSAIITGESSPEARARVFDDLSSGSLDIVLTTPEFLEFHVDRFAAATTFAFAVIDEAHHIGMAKAGNREAYAALGRTLEKLGQPLTLALTATASDGIADSIMATIPIDRVLLDETSRDNLVIDDRRNLKNRMEFLANLIATGEKTVIFVNSREQSVALARELRMRVPQLAMLIGFYNAGLSWDERRRVEELFRSDNFTVLVATSAFGEGVDIPNIRHVVLYHMPFNEIEFNQMSGRAGRDGKPATIHLLYGRADASINEHILSDQTPDHDAMANVYRFLRDAGKETPGSFFPLKKERFDEYMSDPRLHLSQQALSCGLTVFRELGLIETKKTYVHGHVVYSVRVAESPQKVELTDSVRYREGLGERRVFDTFRDWALKSPYDRLRMTVSHPIVPEQLKGQFGCEPKQGPCDDSARGPRNDGRPCDTPPREDGGSEFWKGGEQRG